MSEPAKLSLGDTGANPSDSPSAGYVYFFIKSGIAYVKDSGGTVTQVGSAKTVTGTTASPTTVANGGTITVSAVAVQTIRVAGSGGAVTGVLLSAGTIDDQEVTLEGAHATNTVTTATSGAMAGCDSTIVFGLYTRVKFVWNNGASVWINAEGNYR